MQRASVRLHTKLISKAVGDSRPYPFTPLRPPLQNPFFYLAQFLAQLLVMGKKNKATAAAASDLAPKASKPLSVDKPLKKQKVSLEQLRPGSTKDEGALFQTTQQDGAAPGPAKKTAIDDIFGQLKHKKKDDATQKGGAPHQETQQQQKPPKVEGNKDDLFGAQQSGQRRRTKDGFTIYGEDELGLDKAGGDTKLCPFDCDCCY